MDIHEYISSGIIESYVLGLTSAEERIEFEQMCAQYPQLVEARNNFELALEEQARKNATPPTPNTKEKIWSAIRQSSNTSKIIDMEPTTRRPSSSPWVAAASIILFVIAGVYAFTLYNQNKKLEDSNKDLRERISRADSAQNKIDSIQKLVGDPNVTVVNMVAMQKASPSSANVYWDSTSSNVYLIVKNMPKLPSDKQYQLWAFIEGKPLDLGLFDGGSNKILLMKNTQKADAFAITIENRGNTGGPNREQLQLQGKPRL